MISPLFMGRWGNLLLYFGHVSLELAKWDPLFKHFVNLGRCPLKPSQSVLGRKVNGGRTLAVSGTMNHATATAMNPVHPKKNPVRTPQLGAPLSMMGVTNENWTSQH
jgi:hypothetical protein